MRELILVLIWLVICLVLSVMNGNNCKVIRHRYKHEINFVPCIWFNLSENTPNFQHTSLVLRWFDYYIGIQLKY